jgi:PAS domain S-box-containing protein
VSRPVRRRKRETELESLTAALEGILQENERPAFERMALIAAGVRHPVVITDETLPDRPAIYVSPAFVDLTGYDQQDVIGRNLRFLQGSHTSPTAMQRIQRALGQGEGLTLDILNYRKDGTPFWNELAISPIHDARGQVRYFVGLPRDVTSRKAMRARLELREAQFAAFFERAGIGIALLDRDGIVLAVNTAYTRMLGYTKREFIGLHFTDVVHPSEAESGAALFMELVDGSRDHYQQEMRLMSRNGSVAWGQGTVCAVRGPDGTILQVMSMVQNITERKELDEAKRRSDTFQSLMPRLTVLAMASLNLDDVLPRLCEAIQAHYPVDHVTIFLRDDSDSLVMAAGTFASRLKGVRLSINDPELRAAQAVRSTDVVVDNAVVADDPWIARLSQEGTTRGAVLAAPVMVGEDVGGALALFRVSPGRFDRTDVPNIRQIGRIIGDAIRYAGLFRREHQVVERLTQIDLWRSAFLRTMAHELRTPLSQIVGFTDLLHQSVTGLSDQEQRFLDNTQAAAARMSAVLDQSFDVIRLFATEVQLDRESFDVAALVRQCAEVFRLRAATRDITLQLEEEGVAMRSEGDAGRLHQALSILLDNAVRYTPRGGRILLTTRCTAERIEVEIVDSGPGVPEAMRDFIFSGQAEDVFTRRYGGTGLSLLIARRIAELHGGSLTLMESSEGARFVLALPL